VVVGGATATLQRDGDARATVMDGDGRCDGNAMATTAMERGGDGGGTRTSDGHHRGPSGTNTVPPPHRSRDGFTYARPLPPLYMRDLDHVLGHVSKFNGLSYNNDVYGDDGWGGKTTTKTKEDSEGHSLMRRRTDDIADKII